MEHALLAVVAKPSKLKFNFNYSFYSCVYKYTIDAMMNFLCS